MSELALAQHTTRAHSSQCKHTVLCVYCVCACISHACTDIGTWLYSAVYALCWMTWILTIASSSVLAMLQSPIPLPANLVRDPINKLICHYSREAGIEICSYFIDLVIVVSCKLYWYGMLWFTCEIEQVSRSCMLSLCVVNLHCSVDLCQFRVNNNACDMRKWHPKYSNYSNAYRVGCSNGKIGIRPRPITNTGLQIKIHEEVTSSMWGKLSSVLGSITFQFHSFLHSRDK